MRVLIAHSRYQNPSGEEVVVASEAQLLRDHGHEVHLFETDNASISGPVEQVRSALGHIYSRSGRARFSQAIADFTPDVVHVHNIFPLLSPSVYDAARHAGVPVVQTVHNYRFVCPSSNLYRDGNVCTDCLSKAVPYPGIVHRCYRNSGAQTAAIAVMIGVHKLRRTWQSRVDAFIVLSHAQRALMLEGGFPDDRLRVKPNFLVEPPRPSPPQPGTRPFAIFVGRLCREKGIRTLVQAFVDHDIGLDLVIVGDGEDRKHLENAVRGRNRADTVTFEGSRERSQVFALMHAASVLVFPSEWMETFGLSMIEAYACSTPVLAARLGGLTEIVDDGVTGLFFTPGDSGDLADKLRWCAKNPERLVELGRSGRERYETQYSPEPNYEMLMNCYQAAISRNSEDRRHQV